MQAQYLCFSRILLFDLLSLSQWPGLLPIILPDQWNRSSEQKRCKMWTKVCNRSYFIFQIPHTGSVWQTRKCESSITPTTLTFTVVFPQKGRLKVSSVMGFFPDKSHNTSRWWGLYLSSVEYLAFHRTFPQFFCSIWYIWFFLCNQHSFERFPSCFEMTAKLIIFRIYDKTVSDKLLVFHIF